MVFRRVLELPAVDVVEVASPPAGRVEIVKDPAMAGKHVQIHSSYVGAREMAKPVPAVGCSLPLARMHGIGAMAAYELIRKGALGEVFAMQLSMFDP
jgi:predicted dehydrogenase